MLGGGGMTGTAFHAGVVGALAQWGWDARDAAVMVGTSAGSTSAALLRAGFPPSDYVARMTGGPLSAEGHRILDGVGQVPAAPRRRPGRLRPAAPALLMRVGRRPGHYRLGVALAAGLPEGTIDIDEVSPGYGSLFTSWPDRPTWITAVRLDTGRRVVFGRDAEAPLPEAVSASCAIPGYFRPVVIDGVPHVDGGAWSAHHLDLLAHDDANCDLIVVSAPMSTTDPFAPEVGNIPRAVVREQLRRESKAVTKLGIPVMVVQPDRRLRRLMGMASMDVTRRGVVAEATAAMASRQLSESAAARHLPRR